MKPRRPRVLPFPARAPVPPPITVTKRPGAGLSLQLTFKLPATVAQWRTILAKRLP